MAKLKLSGLLSGLSGKINGSVAARNRGGAYLRTKVTPSNPQTAAQSTARNLMTQYAQAWRGLTVAQRAAWNGAVDGFQTTDVFGDLRTPSGENLYIRLNINLEIAGGTPITTPPAPSSVAALDSISLAVVGGVSFDLTFAPTPIPASTAMMVEATAGMSPGINNFNSRLRKIAVLAAATASPQDLNTQYEAKFGTTVTGQKYGVRCKQISTVTGLVSGSLKDSAIAS
ncbi:MAG: hypothetical protein ACE5FF_03325 [Saprospiraceae bacterium]